MAGIYPTNIRTIRYGVLLVLLFVLSVILAGLTGCGGGSTTTTTPSTKVTLASIAIKHSSTSISVSSSQQLTATGSYSDGSTQDITKTVAWTSSDTTKATVQSTGQANPGLVTGVAAGSVTITAALNGMSDNAALTITSAPVTLSSISVSPLDPTMDAGATQQFFATAKYSDNSTQNVTSAAAWTSSDNTKATVQSTGQANPGLVNGIAAGAVTITASYGGKSGSSILTLTSTNNAATTDLLDMTSSDNYLGFEGGLYENSSDTPPTDQNNAGLAAATAIVPLDSNGNPSSSGKTVFVSIGRSIEEGEFSTFMSQAATNTGVNHATLVIANGALISSGPCLWSTAFGVPPCGSTSENQYDRVRDTVLAPLSVTEKQVQIAWIEEYNADPAGDGFQTLCDPTTAGCSNDVSHTEALRYEKQVGEILRAAKTRWPNLKQAFLSVRLYGGYATTNHSPEPYPYEYGFSAKWLIEAQVLQIRSGGTQIDPIAGDLNYNNGTAPWTAWGPYLWADGDIPRSDGLFWCDGQTNAPCNGEVDYQVDGTHPNAQGDQKVANLLMKFFLASPYTPWFRP
jgi:uncharacterized protein YjdB